MTGRAVRAAAVALCRALLADAGLTVEDLRQRAASRKAKAAAQPGLMVAPTPAPVAPPHVSPAKPARAPRRTAALVAPTERPLDRAARLAGVGRPAVPGVVAKPRPMQGDAIVPEGVKVTVCPAGQDMRYRVDPSQVIEGGFLAEFRARRGDR